jgi:RNA polymerase primary sigma factor
MPEQYLTLDDIKNANSPEKIAALFQKLGYNANAQPLAVDDLELSARSVYAVNDVYLIADLGNGGLQVLLFQLQAKEFSSPSVAQIRMRAIAQSLCKRPSHFLLIGTQDYKQLILVNLRQSFDDQMNLKLKIKTWRYDRTNLTYYDRHRFEAIAAVTSDPQKLYQAQYQAFDFLDKKLIRESYTTDTTDSIRLYLQEIGRFPLLKASEEIELARKITDLLALEAVRKQLCKQLKREPGDKEWAEAVNMPLLRFLHCLHMGRKARNKMVESNLRLVVSLAKKYQNRGLDFQDLIQEGNLGLIHAVQKFDPYMGNRFSTYAYWWIRQAITRAIANQSRIIRLPVHVNETISRMKKTTKLLYQDMGHQPTVAEIAIWMEMPIEKLRFITKSALPPLFLGDMDFLEFEGDTPEDYVFKIILRENLDSVIDTLTSREREVMRMRYGFDDGREKALQEIGDKLNLTRERIRQIEAKAFRKLLDPNRRRVLEEYICFVGIDRTQTNNPTCEQIQPIQVKGSDRLHRSNYESAINRQVQSEGIDFAQAKAQAIIPNTSIPNTTPARQQLSDRIFDLSRVNKSSDEALRDHIAGLRRSRSFTDAQIISIIWQVSMTDSQKYYQAEAEFKRLTRE